MLNEITGKNIQPDYKEQRRADVLHSRADISKAKNILKYEPKIKFKEGLEKTFIWYKENGK
jgi:UDP-N-acetylglucosamine 4-epimerase